MSMPGATPRPIAAATVATAKGFVEAAWPASSTPVPERRRSAQSRPVIRRKALQLLVCALMLLQGPLLAAQYSEQQQALTLDEATGAGGPQRQTQAQAFSDHLDDEGRLVLPEGFPGSFDQTGFDLRLGSDGSPHFLAKGGPGDPDQRWDDRFAAPGCYGAVLAMVPAALAVSCSWAGFSHL